MSWKRSFSGTLKASTMARCRLCDSAARYSGDFLFSREMRLMGMMASGWVIDSFTIQVYFDPENQEYFDEWFDKAGWLCEELLLTSMCCAPSSPASTWAA